MKKEWTNDCVIICNTCGSTSQSYFLEDGGETNFCPNCGSSDIEGRDSEDIEKK